MKLFRETSAETRRVVSENEWLRSQQVRQHTQDASQASKEISKDASKDALMWCQLQEESQAVLPHLQQLECWTKKAEAEAQQLRLENEQASAYHT